VGRKVEVGNIDRVRGWFMGHVPFGWQDTLLLQLVHIMRLILQSQLTGGTRHTPQSAMRAGINKITGVFIAGQIRRTS